MPTYGYARVSTDDQTLDLQLASLKAAGCSKVYSEQISGARSDRPQLLKLMKALRQGDVVVITKLDRLARSTRDLLNLLQAFTDAGVGFKVLDTPMLDTSSATGELLVAVLGAIATFERRLILSRTAEGRKAAMAKGTKFGRKPKLTPHQRSEALARMQAGDSLVAIAKTYGVNPTTIGRLQAA